jgi:hypothetical protein
MIRVGMGLHLLHPANDQPLELRGKGNRLLYRRPPERQPLLGFFRRSLQFRKEGSEPSIGYVHG